MGQPISLRIDQATIERLGVRAERVDIKPRTLAQRYVEEGLRMDEHPLVRFVDGPGGRRARLLGTGLDIWEVIASVRDNQNDLGRTAEYLELGRGLIQAAVSYYAAFPEEIEGWITRNEQAADGAHAAWTAAQSILGR